MPKPPELLKVFEIAGERDDFEEFDLSSKESLKRCISLASISTAALRATTPGVS